jgi:adenylylsulfate kinase
VTGVVIWLTGLPSSGKSTLGERARLALAAEGLAACLLDGDALRGALHPAPGYDAAGRDAFYRTLGELAAMLAGQGLVVLVAATAHRKDFRARARAHAPAFVEVLVDVDPSTCAARDAKGLYAAHRDAGLRGLPGVDLPFEPPDAPDITAAGGLDTDALARIVAAARRLAPTTSR